MTDFEYSEEELVELVGMLAQKYTSYESSSVTYDTARQLLGAVTYCIRFGQRQSVKANQANDTNKANHTLEEKHTSEPYKAKEAYEYGYQCVLEKTKEVAKRYNNMIQEFDSYENLCYLDIVVKGLAAFFRSYDAKFAPQEHLLTLDYPVLEPKQEVFGIDSEEGLCGTDSEALCGIERIDDYLDQIIIEQEFLQHFSREFIITSLRKYDDRCEELVINVCEVVVEKLLTQALGNGDRDRAKAITESKSEEQLKSMLYRLLEKLVDKTSEDDDGDGQRKERQLCYLSHLIDDLAVRLKRTNML